MPFENIVNQAKERLRFVEGLRMAEFPSLRESKERTNRRVLSSLKSLGVATRSEVQALERRVKELEALVYASQKKTQSATRKPRTRK